VYFPIAEVTVSPYYLVGLGIIVGISGGFMGMGGGWLLVPALSALGTPLNMAVGTSLAQMLGSAIVSAMRHWQYGNLSFRIASIMVPGSLLGVEFGADVIEILKGQGPAHVDLGIGLTFVVILTLVSVFVMRDTFRDYTRAQRLAASHPGESIHKYHVTPVRPIPRRVQAIKLKPCIACPVSGIESISIWAILAVASIMGTLTGLLGIGGGLIGLPLLVYVIGVPTHVAVGTVIFTVVISSAFGTFTHALKGNEDLLMALFIFVGAAVGSQIGTVATRYVSGIFIRALFAIAALGAAGSVVLNTFLRLRVAALVVVLAVGCVTSGIIIYLLVEGIMQRRRHQSLGRSSP
jgi:uncharacterized membrane protein YfcA